jgi:hypothetical protein
MASAAVSNPSAAGSAGGKGASAAESGGSEFKWLPLSREYALEREQQTIKRTQTNLHPLLPKEVSTGDI